MTLLTHSQVPRDALGRRCRGRLLLTGCLAVALTFALAATVVAVPVVSRATAWVVRSSATEGATDADGGRLLAGADRYATAVLLAEVPLDAGDAGTGDVLVVSGESLVDAVSVVSLAAARDAAIVLTETGRLPAPVRELLSARGFEKATIGGGPSAVSDAVSSDLAGLVVDDRSGAANADAGRIQGPTRYDTAVEAAEEAGDPGTWCDTGDTTAVLVNGQSLVDGVVAAPVAYAWGLPLLFTEPGLLPDVVADYLRDASVERVVAVGGAGDIGAAVTDALEDLGVEVTALNGRTPAARSVELVEAVEGCQSQPVAPGEYALLDANQPVDGVAAAAALATGLGEHSDADALIPILAVSQNSVPKAVADYLAEAGERYGDITLYPLGGDARLTPQVISRAVAAAEGEAPDDDATDDATDDAAGDVAEPDGAVDGGGEAGDGGEAVIRPPAVSSRHPATNGGAADNGDDATVDAAGASVPAFAATVDLDGDGELSFDELYPADTSHRDAYLEVSDGVAPPGAFAPPVPDLADVSGDDSRRSELSLGRSSHDRFPNGFPLPPGAPDYATTTFDERQQLRADAYAAYTKPDPSWDAPLNTARGQWDDMYARACETQMEDRERNNGRSMMGFETFPCEWLGDWSIWQCDVLNDPAVTRLAPQEQWIELTVRYYDLWVDLVGRDRFHASTIEVTALPKGWLLWIEQYSFNGFWEGTTYVGYPYCSFRLDSEPSQANETFHNQQVTLLRDYFNPRARFKDSSAPVDDYIFQHVWLPRNRWYLDDVCSVDSFGCPSQARAG